MLRPCRAALSSAAGARSWHLRPVRLAAPAFRPRQRLPLCLAVDKQRVDSDPSSSEAAAGTPPPADGLECFGTGQEVECRLVPDGPDPLPPASPEQQGAWCLGTCLCGLCMPGWSNRRWAEQRQRLPRSVPPPTCSRRNRRTAHPLPPHLPPHLQARWPPCWPCCCWCLPSSFGARAWWQ